MYPVPASVDSRELSYYCARRLLYRWEETLYRCLSCAVVGMSCSRGFYESEPSSASWRGSGHKLLKVAIAEVAIVKSEKLGSLVVVADFDLFCCASYSRGCGYGVCVENCVPGEPKWAGEGVDRSEALADSVGSCFGLGFIVGMHVEACQCDPF